LWAGDLAGIEQAFDRLSKCRLSKCQEIPPG
jgi:hypothetical protein